MFSAALMFASPTPGSYELHWQLGGSRLCKTSPLSSVLFRGSLCPFEDKDPRQRKRIRTLPEQFFHLLGAIPKVAFIQSQNLVCFTRDGWDVIRPLQVVVQDYSWSNSTPQKTYFLCGGTFVVERQMILHLAGLNEICHLLCHTSSFFRSSWSWSPSMSLETIPYSSASSTRSLIEDLRLLGRSLTYDRNSKGPNTVPWGTPELT